MMREYWLHSWHCARFVARLTQSERPTAHETLGMPVQARELAASRLWMAGWVRRLYLQGVIERTLLVESHATLIEKATEARLGLVAA